MPADTVTRAVVMAVSDARGVSPSELQTPLADYVDPDALERLVDHEGDWTLSFEFADHEVTVTSEGQVTVDEDPPFVEA